MISRRQFAIAYNKANVVATGRKAPPSEITEAYEEHTQSAAFTGAPNAVPVFFTRISSLDQKLDWDFDLNSDGKLNPTRAYFDPKGDGSAQPTL